MDIYLCRITECFFIFFAFFRLTAFYSLSYSLGIVTTTSQINQPTNRKEPTMRITQSLAAFFAFAEMAIGKHEPKGFRIDLGNCESDSKEIRLVYLSHKTGHKQMVCFDRELQKFGSPSYWHETQI